MAANIPTLQYKSHSANPVRNVIQLQSPTALAAGPLLTYVIPFRCEIGQIAAYAGTAGTGGGSTVLDILVSHLNLTTGVYDTPTSLWGTAANRPTMLAVNTGLFNVARPDWLTNAATLAAGQALSSSLALKPGDVISVSAAISSTGHALFALSIALHLRG
jgi:hypothetical protein